MLLFLLPTILRIDNQLVFVVGIVVVDEGVGVAWTSLSIEPGLFVVVISDHEVLIANGGEGSYMLTLLLCLQMGHLWKIAREVGGLLLVSRLLELLLGDQLLRWHAVPPLIMVDFLDAIEGIACLSVWTVELDIR